MTTALISRPSQSSGNFNQGGNGKYKPLRKRGKGSAEAQAEFDPFNPQYNRMQFKNSRDSIYIAFDYVENQSFSKITSEFVKDNLATPINNLKKTLINLFN